MQKYKLKSAAMFGLDARIALAIFAALSVITGAFLYSILKEVESITLLHEMQQIEKAVTQYYLDTGKHLAHADVFENPHHPIKIESLVKNTENLKNWKGPYIKYKIYYSTYNGLLSDYGRITIRLGQINNPKNDTYPRIGCFDVTEPNCTYWLEMDGLSKFLVTNIDKKVDGKISPLSGTIKHFKNSSGTYNILMRLNF